MSMPISSSLEDYLETIYLLQQEQGFARVKEIAAAREVKAASVSVALRKLAESNLVKYERREYILLTEEGEAAARRIFSRHRLLKRFFSDVLQMSEAAADEQACVLEHSLTDEAMDRFVSLFEFLGNYPRILSEFKQCLTQKSCDHVGTKEQCANCACNAEKHRTIADMEPGQESKVCNITATGALRQRLLDMGILPETTIEMERHGFGGDPVWIRVQGSRLALRKSEASSVLIH